MGRTDSQRQAGGIWAGTRVPLNQAQQVGCTHPTGHLTAPVPLGSAPPTPQEDVGLWGAGGGLGSTPRNRSCGR